MRLARALFFTRGWSPFLVAKDLGRGLLAGYISRRFEDLPWIAKEELITYGRKRTCEISVGDSVRARDGSSGKCISPVVCRSRNFPGNVGRMFRKG